MASNFPDLGGLGCGVTGAGGYVGSVLARHLRGAGARVVEFRRTAPRWTSEIRPLRLGDEPKSETFAGIDALVHCAYDFEASRWDQIHSVNVEGTRRLFRAAAAAGIKRLILISSMSAFPGCRSSYGRAKFEMESIASEFGAAIVRPGLVYGARSGGMMGSLAKLVSIPLFVPLVGSGSSIQHTAHEEDVARLVACLVASPSGWEGVPVTAAHERGYTLREIMSALAVARGRDPRFAPIPTALIATVLRLSGLLGLRSRLRYDSLLGLLHPNPTPDFSALGRLGLNFRPFTPEAIRV